MEIERKALYNLLRMNWIHDPTLPIEPWQVEDYRRMSTPILFQNLKSYEFNFDTPSFIAFTQMVDTPEDFTDILLEDVELDRKEQDQVYLNVFELWRRLVPEKLCLSIFCDELDHTIHLYDNGDPSSAEAIQDALANLQMVFDENVDQGVNPEEIFASVSERCANDLESFLYDYIAEQLDNDNFIYASELLDGFDEYLKGNKWFALLNLRLHDPDDSESVRESLKKTVLKASKENILPFNLELLSYLVQGGEHGEFKKIVKQTIPLLKTEEDFQDLLAICTDFYRCLDEEANEQAIQALVDKRVANDPSDKLNATDKDFTTLLKVIK